MTFSSATTPSEGVDAANVVWRTGFRPGFSFVDLPVLGSEEPIHQRGIVGLEPGLFLIGLKFLYSVSSELRQAGREERVGNGLHRRG
jgi:putative flavoprotein involved in K+ transport